MEFFWCSQRIDVNIFDHLCTKKTCSMLCEAIIDKGCNVAHLRIQITTFEVSSSDEKH